MKINRFDPMKVVEFCRYWDDGECQYRKAFVDRMTELEAAGKDIAALQPRCPRDALRNKKGLLTCYCSRGDKLC